MIEDKQSAGLRRVTPSEVVPIGIGPKNRVIAVTGGKGGVGKSTIAVNLAVHWARRGSRTLAVDGDLGMADLNLLLGLAPARSLLDLIQGASVDEVLVDAHGIKLLPGLNGSFALANLDPAAREKIFRAVDQLGERFDTLVVDTPAGIGESAMAFAGAAADIIVVATPEPLSLADAYACLKVLTMRQGITRAYLLPNAVRSPSEAEQIVNRLTALVDRFLGITLVPLPAVPWDPQVPVAAAAGVPLVLHSPDGAGARGIARAARRIDALAEAEGPGVGSWLKNALGKTGEEASR